MESKTVKMVVNDLLSAENQRRRRIRLLKELLGTCATVLQTGREPFLLPNHQRRALEQLVIYRLPPPPPKKKPLQCFKIIFVTSRNFRPTFLQQYHQYISDVNKAKASHCKAKALGGKAKGAGYKAKA